MSQHGNVYDSSRTTCDLLRTSDQYTISKLHDLSSRTTQNCRWKIIPGWKISPKHSCIWSRGKRYWAHNTNSCGGHRKKYTWNAACVKRTAQDWIIVTQATVEQTRIILKLMQFGTSLGCSLCLLYFQTPTKLVFHTFYTHTTAIQINSGTLTKFAEITATSSILKCSIP